jgi:hypothetical protein
MERVIEPDVKPQLSQRRRAQGCIKLQEPRAVGVAETSNLPAPLRLLHAADWKSAIQQSGTQRYFFGVWSPLEPGQVDHVAAIIGKDAAAVGPEIAPASAALDIMNATVIHMLFLVFKADHR